MARGQLERGKVFIKMREKVPRRRLKGEGRVLAVRLEKRETRLDSEGEEVVEKNFGINKRGL